MKIESKEIKVKDLVNGYKEDEGTGSVVGYGGLLNIRPPFQREFIYKDPEKIAVIETIQKGFPLNVMYWSENKDGSFELLDGQQRTLSICHFIENRFSINFRGMVNLTEEEKNQILEYPLMIYVCKGQEKEKLDWFKIINVAGIKLTDQELLNAIYTGPWLSDAKMKFSKTNCPASRVGNHLLTGSPIRQDLLEKVLSWIAHRDNLAGIEEYMSKHQHDKDANDLWLYFDEVASWVNRLFPKEYYRKEMKGLDWGIFYNKYKNKAFNPSDLEEKVKELMMDDDVTKKKGIYEFLLSGDEKYLSIRMFTPAMKRAVYERQDGICIKCGNKFELEETEADHITPWSEGGKTNIENCQILCKTCNRKKSNK